MTLLLAGAGLTVAIVLILCVPLLRPRRSGDKRPDFDIAVYKDQLRELERDRERGLLSDDQAAQARVEIERRLLAADERQRGGHGFHGARKATAMMLLATPLIPAGAVAVYVWLGNPDMPDMPFAARTDVQPPDTENGLPDATQFAEMIERLRARLVEEPDDPEGWALLGRSLIELGRYPEARDALLITWELTDDPYIRAEAAEADVAAAGSTVTDRALEAFEALHEIDPFEPKSRFYIGLAAAQSGDGAAAMQEWVDLIVVSPRGAPWLETVRNQIIRIADETGTDPATLRPSEEASALAEQAAAAIPESMPDAIPGPSAEDIQNAQQMSPEEQTAFIRSMVQRLAERLEENPDDREGWLRLARAYQVLGEEDKATEALERAQAAAE